ncbi:hypothetical protein MLD38_010667 [Melastoma candidum]|uniref:Uncharacterized protein n=1 Tax=Melastoma candidum TaxID=119954 RepID=A0ACB9R0L3_9MYRT|nr:hypothetical protein MLD38_010667 [Melastoma candidum]
MVMFAVPRENITPMRDDRDAGLEEGGKAEGAVAMDKTELALEAISKETVNLATRASLLRLWANQVAVFGTTAVRRSYRAEPYTAILKFKP